MSGLLKTNPLTSTVQVISIGSQDPPISITLNSTAGNRGIRFSNSRSGAANTYYTPDIDAAPTGSISVAALAPVKWVEFTGNIGDIYEVQ